THAGARAAMTSILQLSQHASITLELFSLTGAAHAHISPLSLHDALPISPSPEASRRSRSDRAWSCRSSPTPSRRRRSAARRRARSEEHTSELQSLRHLVCRLLLEKKNERSRDARSDPQRSASARAPRVLF